MGVWGSAQRNEKDISGCGIVGIMNEGGDAFSGEAIAAAICNMMERGNGLGAGFAGYGIYPDLKDYWCFHIMYQDERAREARRYNCLGHDPYIFILSAFIPAYPARGGMGHSANFPVN